MNAKTVIKECAQKNGKIDENSNEDKEGLDGIERRMYGSEDNEGDENDEVEESETNDVIIMGIEPKSMAIESIDTYRPTSPPIDESTPMNQPPRDTNPVKSARSNGAAGSKRFECFHLCKLLMTYSRQINSVGSGFVLMLATGIQIVWGLNTLYKYRDKEMPKIVFATVSIYYVGAIIGSVTGACLVSLVRKRIIYVSST